MHSYLSLLVSGDALVEGTSSAGQGMTLTE